MCTVSSEKPPPSPPSSPPPSSPSESEDKNDAFESGDVKKNNATRNLKWAISAALCASFLLLVSIIKTLILLYKIKFLICRA